MSTARSTIDRQFERRMTNPAFVLPDGFKGIGSLLAAISKGGVAATTLELIGLRVSQINGCTSCVQGHWEAAKALGETDERIITLAAWRESPYFDDAERAAFELCESLTRLADRSDDAVPDDLWETVTRYYNESQVSAVILQVALLNLFNRINVAVREQADRPSWKQPN